MIKKKIYGETLKEQLLASAKDRLYIFVLAAGGVRGAILRGTRMVNEMRANHGLGILETLALGHAYLGCGLMSAGLKGNDRISLQIDCSGPIKGLCVEANAFREVRGYLKQVPIRVDAPLEDFSLAPFFGAGFLSVTRHLEDAKHPFTGRVMLQHGTIAKDLANYYLTSEQVATAFHLSVRFDRQGEVIGAGGLFLQAMPGVEPQTAADLEDRVRDMPSLGTVFSGDIDPERFVRDRFADYGYKYLADYRVEFMCHCNRGRVRSLLTLLPLDELRDIRANGPFPLELTCHYCGTPYRFSQTDIQKIYGLRYPNN